MTNEQKEMDKLIALCKGRGFVYAGSEIYGGLANSWDYGPLGVLLKRNIKQAWWDDFIAHNPLNVGLDSAILMNPKVWEASGHVGGFQDPLMDCKECKTRHRADTLIEDNGGNPIGMSNADMETYIADNRVVCPNCGKSNFTNIRQFNLMFKTFAGVTEDAKSEIYLRPETAQGIFVNFKNVVRTSRKTLPFGIGQIGKSFRNEITPGNFIFRIREFEQMELEFFCKPGTEIEWFTYWKDFCQKWLYSLSIKPENIKMRDHSKEELSHYSNATTDIEFLFPFGWGELWGIASRTDYDLKQHTKFSGESMEYNDLVNNEKFIPYVVEPSLGADRITLALLTEAYDEEKIDDNDTRVVMRFHPRVAPYKVAVLPLSKKLGESARKVFDKLSESFSCDYDESGSIGKRYRREDEIGTPFCITYDFDSEEDNSVTIRNRDTMEQERVKIDELENVINEKIKAWK